MGCFFKREGWDQVIHSQQLPLISQMLSQYQQPQTPFIRRTFLVIVSLRSSSIASHSLHATLQIALRCCVELGRLGRWVELEYLRGWLTAVIRCVGEFVHFTDSLHVQKCRACT